MKRFPDWICFEIPFSKTTFLWFSKCNTLSLSSRVEVVVNKEQRNTKYEDEDKTMWENSFWQISELHNLFHTHYNNNSLTRSEWIKFFHNWCAIKRHVQRRTEWETNQCLQITAIIQNVCKLLCVKTHNNAWTAGLGRISHSKNK